MSKTAQIIYCISVVVTDQDGREYDYKYVGKTQLETAEDRLAGHMSSSKDTSNQHNMARALRNGRVTRVDVLESGVSEEDVFTREKYWTDLVGEEYVLLNTMNYPLHKTVSWKLDEYYEGREEGLDVELKNKTVREATLETREYVPISNAKMKEWIARYHPTLTISDFLEIKQYGGLNTYVLLDMYNELWEGNQKRYHHRSMTKQDFTRGYDMYSKEADTKDEKRGHSSNQYHGLAANTRMPREMWEKVETVQVTSKNGNSTRTNGYFEFTGDAVDKLLGIIANVSMCSNKDNAILFDHTLTSQMELANEADEAMQILMDHKKNNTVTVTDSDILGYLLDTQIILTSEFVKELYKISVTDEVIDHLDYTHEGHLTGHEYDGVWELVNAATGNLSIDDLEEVINIWLDMIGEDGYKTVRVTDDVDDYVRLEMKSIADKFAHLLD